MKPLWKTARVSLNTKHTGSIWSWNPTPRFRSGEIHHSKWHVHPKFQASTIYNSQDIGSTKMSTDRKMKSIHRTTTQPLKRMKWRYWQQHGWTEKFSNQVRKVREKQTNILRYHTQVRSINSYQWTNVQNRNGLTDWEKQILIIKRKLEGRDKLRILINI